MASDPDDFFHRFVLLEDLRSTSWKKHYPSEAPEMSRLIRDLEDDSITTWVKVSSSDANNPAIQDARQALIRSLPALPTGLDTPLVEAVLRLNQTFRNAELNQEPEADPLWRPNLKDLPNRLTRPETLSFIMPVLWADSEFWRVLRDVDEKADMDSAAEAYLLHTYHVRFRFGRAVWNQLVQFPIHRRYIFEMIPFLPGRFCSVPENACVAGGPNPAFSQRTLDSARDALLGHLKSGSPDPLTAFAKQQLPPTALKAIQAACDRLREDAAWCLEHPGMVPAPRSTLPRPSAARIRRAQILERMVAMLHTEPDLPDFDLAKRAVGDPGSTGRTQAKDAKVLASLRDRVVVTCYEKRVPRKGRGAG